MSINKWTLDNHKKVLEEALFSSIALDDGVLKAMLEAYTLQQAKGEDYQAGNNERDAYFPLGLASYATMINIKARRLVALAQKEDEPTHESVRDTALDLINYAAFLVDRLDRENADAS